MVGRRGAVAQEQLFEVFLSFEKDIVNDNRVVVPSAKIWNNLHMNYFPKLNAKAIKFYSAALRWWANRIKNVSAEYTRCDEDEFNEVSIEDQDHQDSTFNTTNSDSGTQNPINFNIYLSPEVWKKISPVPVQYNRKRELHRRNESRTFMTLKKGLWTNVILEKIDKHRKNIICNWAFQRCKVYVSGRFYVTMSAKCVNCGANLHGFIKNREATESEAIRISFSVKNFNEKFYNSDILKTVKNTGSKIKEVQQSTKSAIGLKQQMASSNIPMFGKFNGRQFSLNAIRCAKYRKRNVSKMSECPFTALCYLKKMNAYANTIHMIGIDPLVVLYISPNQIRLFKAYKKHNPYTRISCDATGGLVRGLGT